MMARPLTLDPDNPSEAILIEVVKVHRAKSHDYAADDDIYSNFREVGEQMDSSPLDACDTLVAVKQARIKQLRRKGDPKNESLRDSYIDRLVYALIAVVLYDEEVADG